MAHITGDARPLGAPGSRSRWLVFLALFLGAAVAVVGSVVLLRALRPGSPAQAVVPVVTAGPTPTPTATATPVPTATEDPQIAAVLQAYVDANAAYVHASLTSNPSDPGLVATTSGPARLHSVAFIAVQQTLHITVRGDIVLRDPRVLSVNGTTATASSCVVDTARSFNAAGQPVNSRTGQILPSTYDPNVPSYYVSHAKLTLVDGTWKVNEDITNVVSESACRAG